jgi:hypothetical protein
VLSHFKTSANNISPRNQNSFIFLYLFCARGSLVVKTLDYKPEGREFETRWGAIYLILPAAHTCVCVCLLVFSCCFVLCFVLFCAADNNKKRQAGKNTHTRIRKLTKKAQQKNTNGNIQSITTCMKRQQKQRSRFLQESKSKTSPEDGHVGRNMYCRTTTTKCKTVKHLQ